MSGCRVRGVMTLRPYRRISRRAIQKRDRPSTGACCTGHQVGFPETKQMLVPEMPCRRVLETERCGMKAIAVTDEAAGTAGMTLVERPEPEPAINEVVVEVHAS